MYSVCLINGCYLIQALIWTLDYVSPMPIVSASFQVLHDAEYKLAVNAIKLRRHVEMYQWVEHESKK